MLTMVSRQAVYTVRDHVDRVSFYSVYSPQKWYSSAEHWPRGGDGFWPLLLDHPRFHLQSSGKLRIIAFSGLLC
jgi:hypothetical protein